MKEIVISCGLQQSLCAIMTNGELEDIFVEHDCAEGVVGNIYKGRVDNVVAGMQSAFVDIGLEKNAFLYAGDIFPQGEPGCDISKLLKQGQEIIVQITKEASGVKGARVSMSITLPARELVLMPMYDYIGISKKIADENERERLKELTEQLRNEKHGYIVRTGAFGASEDKLRREMDFLEERWAEIIRQAKVLNAPCLLHRENGLILSVLRDYFDASCERMVINNKDQFERAKCIAGIITPELAEKIELDESDLFAARGIDTKIRKLLDRRVWLNNGAYLIIDYTEALTVIDVNTGKFTGDRDLGRTILQTNLLAAREIAKQLRLRAIGGIIIVDFIDMEAEEDRKQVLDELEKAASGDKVKTNILGFAPLGLVEMTRKKSRISLASALQQTCPYCDGDGLILNEKTIVNSIFFELSRTFARCTSVRAVLRLNPYIYNAVKTQTDLLHECFPKKQIYVRQDATMHVEDYNIAVFPENEPISDTEVLVKLF